MHVGNLDQLEVTDNGFNQPPQSIKTAREEQKPIKYQWRGEEKGRRDKVIAITKSGTADKDHPIGQWLHN